MKLMNIEGLKDEDQTAAPMEPVKVSEVVQEPITAETETISEEAQPVEEAVEQSPVNKINVELAEHVRDLFINNKMTKPERKVYFSTKGSPNINIGHMSFAPTRMALISPMFERTYGRELDKILFNDKAELDQDKLVHLFILYQFINKGEGPIKISFPAFRKHEDKIIRCLNEFFNKNIRVIKSAYEMFNGAMLQKQGDPAMGNHDYVPPTVIGREIEPETMKSYVEHSHDVTSMLMADDNSQAE